MKYKVRCLEVMVSFLRNMKVINYPIASLNGLKNNSMESFIIDAITFIHIYQNMGNADTKSNARIIRRAVPEQWKAEHLFNSWSGRNNAFGNFFLNIDNPTQEDFIEFWGIQVNGLADYKEATRKNPMSVLFSGAPVTITWLHEILKYFYKSGIGDSKDLILTNLPADDKCYGNLMNWDSYILSLSADGCTLILHQLNNQIVQ